MIAFAAVASPQILMLVLHAPPALGAEAAALQGDGWWTLMAVRKPSHIFIWGDHGVVAPLGWLAAFWLAALAALWSMVSPELRLRLAAIGLATLVFCAIAYAAFALRPTPVLAGLVLTRAALLPVVLLPALIAALAALALRRWTETGAPLDVIRAALFACALAVMALADAGTPLRAMALACLCGGAVLGWPRDRRRRPSRPCAPPPRRPWSSRPRRWRLRWRCCRRSGASPTP